VRKGRVLLGSSQTKVKAGNKVVFNGANISVAKLTDQEKFKRDEHPLDAYRRLKADASAGNYPKPPDNFRPRNVRSEVGTSENAEGRNPADQSPKSDSIGPPIKTSMGSRFHSYS